MDLWVVAAATGAGYVAKYWQNLSGQKQSSLESKSVLSPCIQSDPCQVVVDKAPDTVSPSPNLARRWLIDGDSSSLEKEGKFEKNLQDHTEIPVSGLPPIFVERRVFQLNEINGKNECFHDSCSYLHELGTKKTSSNYSFASMRSSLATRINERRLICRPENDVKTQSDRVTDYKIQREAVVFLEEETAPFKPVGSAKLPRRPEETYGSKQSSIRESGNGIVLLFIGITLGALSTAIANQRVLENLNKLLEHAEDLVQDLLAELEMKERLTIETLELANEDHQKQGTYNLSPFIVSSSSKPESDESLKHEAKNADSPKAENFELTNDVEAELEAELQKLEENMKGSILQRISDILEIDSDFEADMSEGDLKLDTVNRRSDRLSDSDHNGKDRNDATLSPNYAVSWLDLSIRLHEVIESNLRARIDELEAVLQNSQSQPHLLLDSKPENPFLGL